MPDKQPVPSLAALDLGQRLDGAAYEERLKAAQRRLRQVQLAYWARGHAGVVVLEGWDAAGKGGVIRRMAAELDPRGIAVWSISAPSEEELRQHYLQRFWARLPEDREIAVFDRSWYGRVLVERVERLAPPPAWSRAYDEINAFEKLLADDGTRVVKVFLHISLEEQKRRMRARVEEPLKRWKLSRDDLRNIELRDAYEAAIEDMLASTSTAEAPWRVIPAESKRFGRVAALEAIADALAEGVDLSPPPLDPETEALARKLLQREA